MTTVVYILLMIAAVLGSGLCPRFVSDIISNMIGDIKEKRGVNRYEHFS